MNEQVYLKRGNTYSVTEGDFDVLNTLDDGIYRIIQLPMTNELKLIKIGDRFHFGYKLYGLDEDLINHVINTYNKQENKGNIGVLLNGTKGTGKTVTAKYLCNKLGLPVIIVDAEYAGLATFIASINHDCIFLFDEFEKNFRLFDGEEEHAGESLLSIMDGVYNNNTCHIFILTTNELKIDENLISRPSRIRYLKSFGPVISKDIIEEFIDDNLKYPQYKQEIMEYIETLTMATIDIVKSIVDEVNIHNCGVDSFKRFFNVKEAVYNYTVQCLYVDEKNYDEDELHIDSTKMFAKYVNLDYKEKKKARFNVHYSTLQSKKNIKKFKVGDKFPNSGFIIEEIDLKNSVIKCFKKAETSYKLWYYFENIDEKPSVFNTEIEDEEIHNWI